MVDSLAGVVLAAGGGTRLRPLTLIRPKALCPVGNVPLVDLALRRAGALTSSVAVNVHHGRTLMEEHLARRVHLSIEEPDALGTAGALGHLRDWIAGRPVLVVNADAWSPQPLAPLADGWDGERIRLLVVDDPVRADFQGRWRYAGACLMPWSEAASLPDSPAGLYEHSWREAAADGRLELVPSDEVFFDCGTPADYLAANLAASGGASIIGPGAMVEGHLEESVVWPGVLVRRDERLVRAIRASRNVTVLVR
jgi:MurNAc alpha-1-phosphate uridylyltransferase